MDNFNLHKVLLGSIDAGAKCHIIIGLPTKKLWGRSDVNWLSAESVGNSEGLFFVWCTKYFSIKHPATNRRFILIMGKIQGLNGNYEIGNIYAPNDEGERSAFWEELLLALRAWDVTWCIEGDFNAIKCIEERTSCTSIDKSMPDFSNFIEESGLMDIPMIKGLLHLVQLSGQCNLYFTFARCKANFIGKTIFQGREIENPNNIREPIANHYENFYGFKVVWKLKELYCGLYKLTEHSIASLEVSFSEFKIWEAINSCEDNKAPGPDEINFCFLKKQWNTIKEEMMKFVVDFQRTNVMNKRVNATFIMLILKCDSPSTPNDYRPISLVKCLYKIISKALTLQLWKVIDEGFLDKVMRLMGFENKWCTWINGCISTAMVSILVNSAFMYGVVNNQLIKGVAIGTAWADMINCKVGKIPSTYLGLFFGAISSSVSVW
ncbi:Uncharacterized protein TCM_024668 [Theobroma cacao]|uniref:Reverse transcriptase zinc-binding domain-containing protein n=1 Tax=Theobroma cacao TaxID=3641 RepID=A0A061EW11_THECC|nr:Uncharacterized protein TCM_024668 [Theobroma cacao]